MTKPLDEPAAPPPARLPESAMDPALLALMAAAPLPECEFGQRLAAWGESVRQAAQERHDAAQKNGGRHEEPS